VLLESALVSDGLFQHIGDLLSDRFEEKIRIKCDFHELPRSAQGGMLGQQRT